MKVNLGVRERHGSLGCLAVLAGIAVYVLAWAAGVVATSLAVWIMYQFANWMIS